MQKNYLYRTTVDVFPFGWEREGELFEVNGEQITDKAIIYHKGLWYIFYGVGNSRQHELKLIYSDKLEEQWKIHPMSPIVVTPNNDMTSTLIQNIQRILYFLRSIGCDINRFKPLSALFSSICINMELNPARPGGKIIKLKDGRIILYLQYTGKSINHWDIRRYYGKYVTAIIINKLTSHGIEYSFYHKNILSPTGIKYDWNCDKMHHICPVQAGDKIYVAVDGWGDYGGIDKGWSIGIMQPKIDSMNNNYISINNTNLSEHRIKIKSGISDLFDRIVPALFKKEVVYNYNKFCPNKIGHALLYYKTDLFFAKRSASEYRHTNNWEIHEIVKVLNELGYWVDITDRSVDITKLKLKDKYDIFIGIGSGNSGKYYSKIASQLPSAIKIFYATGANPDISKKYMLKRYDLFSKRNNGKQLKLRRIADKVNLGLAMKYTDMIFTIGNKTTIDTYKKYIKPTSRIFPSTSPKIEADIEQLKKRDQKKFLYFSGNGALVKGLDILLETFSQLEDLELYICCPLDEDDFFGYYMRLISSSKNIHLIGFVKVSGKKFNEITSKCGYVILPSASEGTATSVVTCMRRGLIPVVTRECGVDIGDFGFLIKDIGIDALKKQILGISKIDDRDFVERSIKTYIDSFKYTQANFSLSFRKALLSSIKTLV